MSYDQLKQAPPLDLARFVTMDRSDGQSWELTGHSDSAFRFMLDSAGVSSRQGPIATVAIESLYSPALGTRYRSMLWMDIVLLHYRYPVTVWLL